MTSSESLPAAGRVFGAGAGRGRRRRRRRRRRRALRHVLAVLERQQALRELVLLEAIIITHAFAARSSC